MTASPSNGSGAPRETRSHRFAHGVRFDDALMDRLRRAAEKDGRNVAGFVRHVLRRELDAREALERGEAKL